MRVLITGAAGFIGSHLVEHHLNKGDMVYGIDNLSSGQECNITPFMNNPNFRFSNQDIVTWKDIDKIVTWADLIYQMAAVVGMFKVLEEPERVLAVNIAGCERLLRAIRTADWKPRVIIASSSEVYGPTNQALLQEDANLIIESNARNRWHYAVSKLADESFGLAYYRKFGIPITLIRFFNTVGPRQTGRYGMVVPRLVDQAIENEPLTVFGDGEQSRSFCDVRDTAKILDQLAHSEKSIGEIVNVGNDQEITINNLAELIKKLAGSDSPIDHISYEKAYGEEYVDIRCRRPDLTKLQSLIDLKFDWNLEGTIKDVIKSKRKLQS
ncbi:MAG: GDP-mannose 4,6-dehydratase [Gammaproteobacteria bacterium]|nr:GDP-mannose 4,6-dehydratase [Gammaproteobacteria bacterium]